MTHNSKKVVVYEDEMIVGVVCKLYDKYKSMYTDF